MKKFLLLFALILSSVSLAFAESSVNFMNQTYVLKLDKKIGTNGYIRVYMPPQESGSYTSSITKGQYRLSELSGDAFQKEMAVATQQIIKNNQAGSNAKIIWKKMDYGSQGKMIIGSCASNTSSENDIVCTYVKMGIPLGDEVTMFNYGRHYNLSASTINFDSEYTKIKSALEAVY